MIGAYHYDFLKLENFWNSLPSFHLEILMSALSKKNNFANIKFFNMIGLAVSSLI